MAETAIELCEYIEDATARIEAAAQRVVDERDALLQCLKRIRNLYPWEQHQLYSLIDETLGKLAGPR